MDADAGKRFPKARGEMRERLEREVGAGRRDLDHLPEDRALVCADVDPARIPGENTPHDLARFPVVTSVQTDACIPVVGKAHPVDSRRQGADWRGSNSTLEAIEHAKRLLP